MDKTVSDRGCFSQKDGSSFLLLLLFLPLLLLLLLLVFLLNVAEWDKAGKKNGTLTAAGHSLDLFSFLSSFFFSRMRGGKLNSASPMTQRWTLDSRPTPIKRWLRVRDYC